MRKDFFRTHWAWDAVLNISSTGIVARRWFGLSANKDNGDDENGDDSKNNQQTEENRCNRHGASLAVLPDWVKCNMPTL